MSGTFDEAEPAAMAAIIALLTAMESGDYQQRLDDPRGYGALAQVAERLNNLALTLDTQAEINRSEQKRLDVALNMVTDLAILKFDQRLDLAGDHSTLDGLFAGLNMLSEELRYSVVSRVELENSEREFRSIFEQGRTGVVFIDLKGLIVKCNARYAEMYGFTQDHMVGRPVNSFLSEDERRESEAGRERMIRGEIQHFAMERRIVRADGSVLSCLLNASKIQDDQGRPRYVVGILQDISETKQLQAALTTASKMTALGEMAGGIAHEINNPLGIIQGKASQLNKMMRMNKLTAETATKHLDAIIATSERIAKIIRGLRSFSRNADKDPITSIDVRELLDNVLGLCTERFSVHGIGFAVGAVPDVTLDCRGVQLEQVLLNLLNNAHDAVEELEQKWVHIDVELNNDRLAICVTDSGPGIPPQIVDKLMQPFFTTKELGKGTGLGLSIAKGIVEDHQGKLRYDANCPNTRFVIDMPLKQEGPPPKAA